MNSADLPVIFASGARRQDTFFHRSLFNLKFAPEFLHYHDVLELGVCLGGSGTYLSSECEKRFCAGDVQVIPPFHPHYNIADKDGSLWTFIDVDVPRISSAHVSASPVYFNELARSLPVRGIFTEAEAPTVVWTVRSIASLMQSERTPDALLSDLIAAKISALLLELSVLSIEGQATTDTAKRTDVLVPAINLVATAIESGNKITPSDMATACFMSESYFRRIFSSLMGEPPKTYIVRMQMKKAAELLVTTPFSVTQIARLACFEDNSTFYRQFIKAYGIAPTEYRRNVKIMTPPNYRA